MQLDMCIHGDLLLSPNANEPLVKPKALVTTKFLVTYDLD